MVHPPAAGAARPPVNDHTTDAGRGRLVVLIPEVVGVRGGGFEWEVRLVAAVAARALLDVPERDSAPWPPA